MVGENVLTASGLGVGIPVGGVGAFDVACVGVAAMLLIAAFIEAFWSSIAAIPAWGKYSVAAVLWTAVLVWLWRGGRGAADAD